MSDSFLSRSANILSVRSRSSLIILANKSLVAYYLGQFISFMGTWVQVVALGWTVLQLTHSSIAMGAVTAVQTIPSVLLSAATGAFVDGRRRKAVLQANQIARGTVSLLFALVIGSHLPVVFFFPLAFLAGTFNAIDTPIRQSLMYALGGDERAADITAVNSFVFNAARIIAGPVAGTILATYGAAACFLAAAASYILLFVSLSVIREPAIGPANSQARPDVWGRIASVLEPTEMRLMLATLLIYSATTLNHIQIFTIYVKQSLDMGPRTLGLMVGAVGTGALCSATILLWIEKKSRVGLLLSALVPPGCFVALSLSYWPGLAIAIAGVFGFFLVQFTVRLSARIQMRASAHNRGTVTGLYLMCLTGATPIGVMLSGTVAEYWGIRNALISCAAGASIGFLGLLSALRRDCTNS